MRDYVEDNMVSKDPLFDKKFTRMLEAALGNATEEDGEQRELARTLLQAWKVAEEGARLSLQVHLRQEPAATTTRRPRVVREECRRPPRILGS